MPRAKEKEARARSRTKNNQPRLRPAWTWLWLQQQMRMPKPSSRRTESLSTAGPMSGLSMSRTSLRTTSRTSSSWHMGIACATGRLHGRECLRCTFHGLPKETTSISSRRDFSGREGVRSCADPKSWFAAPREGRFKLECGGVCPTSRRMSSISSSLIFQSIRKWDVPEGQLKHHTQHEWLGSRPLILITSWGTSLRTTFRESGPSIGTCPTSTGRTMPTLSSLQSALTTRGWTLCSRRRPPRQLSCGSSALALELCRLELGRREWGISLQWT